MKNLIITPAVGLKTNEVEFFLKSLRNYYKDDIYFLIGSKDLNLKNKLKSYDCIFEEVSVHKYDIQLKRYKLFSRFLQKNKHLYNYRSVNYHFGIFISIYFQLFYSRETHYN